MRLFIPGVEVPLLDEAEAEEAELEEEEEEVAGAGDGEAVGDASRWLKFFVPLAVWIRLALRRCARDFKEPVAF